MSGTATKLQDSPGSNVLKSDVNQDGYLQPTMLPTPPVSSYSADSGKGRSLTVVKGNCITDYIN